MKTRFHPLSAPIIGGYSVIEHVRNSMGTFLALKRPRNDKTDSVNQWQREVSILSALQHPHVIRLLEVSEDEKGPFMALEWIDGGSLAAQIDHHPISAQALTSVLRPVLQAVAALHQFGYAHADINASNVLLGTCGMPTVIDFGNAHPLNDIHTRAIDEPNVGSVYHMAPELFAGAAPSVQSDLYALGIMASHALTGRFPFEGDSSAQIITAHLRQNPDIVAESPLKEWICHLMGRDPVSRPISAIEALQSLPRL